MDRCFICKHFWEDRSVGAFDCMKSEVMDEEDFEKYFVNAEARCPYYEDMDEEEYVCQDC